MTVTHSGLALATATDAVTALIGASGKLVYRKSPSSVASPGTAIATLALSADAFADANGTTGVATANSISSDTNATGDASNDVAYATLETSGGTVVIHCAVTASSGDINMSNGLRVNPGDTVSCSSLTYKAIGS